MTLASGSKLGPYEILGQIGAGGMGEVYRAKDPRLGREVAIKVLPPSFSQDADRLRRFEQEAKAAGVLNHPNITAVYDIGTNAGDDAPYVVQELLEGETLRGALASGKLPQRRVIDYALQIAHGLSAAHDKGIVHRDLKPENLFVTNEGRVKILDFGLAKLTQVNEGAGPQTNLPTAAGTEPGMVMGTIGYMSPEQIKGKPADARSDIFSFGAIFYEMISGKRAFHADSAGETMAAILKEDPPDLSVTNQNVSPGIERIVRHCLEKNPEQRFHSAHDLAFDIEALSGTTGQAAVVASTPRRLRLAPALLLGAGVLAGAAAAYLLLRGGRAATPAAGPGATFRRLTNLSGAETSPTLSPDGQTIAFVHRSGGPAHVWTQRVTGHKPIDLTPDCDRISYSPAFSPDGSLIAYGSRCGEGGLFIMGASGENVRRVASFGADPAWSADGREVVFSTEAVANPYGRMGTSELWRVALGGAEPQKIYAQDAIQPSVSPHGLRIAFWALPTGGSQRDIWTIPYKGLEAGEKAVPVTNDPAVDWNPVWSPDGRQLYFLSNRDGAMNLWSVPIDEPSGKVLGPARSERLPAREVGGFALSRDGRVVVYVDRETTYAIDRLTFDAEARLIGKPDEIYESSQEMSDSDLSPDGTLFAFDSRGGTQDDIFVLGSDGKGLRQLTDDVYRDRHPAFSPDGKRLAFHSDRSGRYDIWTIATDGSGLAQMTKSTGDTIIEPLWSPDGKHVATNSGKASFVATLDEKGVAAKMQKIPEPGASTFFLPLAWSVDGQHLLGAVSRLPDRQTNGLLFYSPETNTLSEPFRGIKTAGNARRGSFLGNRAVHLDNDGIHVADLAAGTERLVLPNTDVGRYNYVVCRGATTCYVVRASDNADIWLRSEGAPAH